MATNLNGGAGLQSGAKTRDAVPSRRPVWIGLVVAGVFLVQVAIIYALLPRSDAAARASLPDTQNSSPLPLSIDPDPDPGDTAEVPVGEFNFSNGTASPGSIVHVDFKISAVTSANLASTLEQRLKSHQARIRQIVNKIVRSASLEELNDPNLGTIKRLMREEVNRLLRKSYVMEIVITDVRVIEQ